MKRSRWKEKCVAERIGEDLSREKFYVVASPPTPWLNDVKYLLNAVVRVVPL